MAEMDYVFDIGPAEEILFGFVNDVSLDMTLRTSAFSLLMKTTDAARIRRLVAKMALPDSDQMRGYMSSAVRSLLENDAPDMEKYAVNP